MNASRILLLLLVALLVALHTLGCSETPSPTAKRTPAVNATPTKESALTLAELLPPNAQRVHNLQEVLDGKLATSKSILFRSWNGVWIGTDCDTEIKLLPGGAAILTEFGDGVDAYNGTCSVGPASQLTLTLKNYVGTWPAMLVYQDGADLLLMPAGGPTGFVFGNRGGATVRGNAGSFWPFRQVAK